MIGREPDITILLDMAPSTGLARAKGRQGHEERFEDMGLELQQKMRAGFLALAQEFSHRFVIVNGDQPPEDVAAEVLTATLKALGH